MSTPRAAVHPVENTIILVPFKYKSHARRYVNLYSKHLTGFYLHLYLSSAILLYPLMPVVSTHPLL